jgi:hypothetical protein
MVERSDCAPRFGALGICVREPRRSMADGHARVDAGPRCLRPSCGGRRAREDEVTNRALIGRDDHGDEAKERRLFPLRSRR